MSKKAQTSLEMIIIALVVIVIATSIVGLYNSINQPTIALGLAKTSTLSALNASQSNFTINEMRIALQTGSAITFAISTTPTSITCFDIKAGDTKNLIISKNWYSTVNINLNGILC